jgi:hypothetical protein
MTSLATKSRSISESCAASSFAPPDSGVASSVDCVRLPEVISEYVAVCEEARQHAYQLMITHAMEHGADAVIAFRYDATEFSQGSTEVLAYGTAVKLRKIS